MRKVVPVGDYDWRTAPFWARFQSEDEGVQERHTLGPALYSTRRGEFFWVNRPPNGPSRKGGDESSQSPISGEAFESKDELRLWLKEQCHFILSNYPDEFTAPVI